MLRNYGTEDGNLYKPESMGVGDGAEAEKMEAAHSLDENAKGQLQMPDFENTEIAENSEDTVGKNAINPESGENQEKR